MNRVQLETAIDYEYRRASDTSMMPSAKITIGGPSPTPGSSRWKQQLTAT